MLSQKIPEASFGIMTPRVLDIEESRRYLTRKVEGLRKKHILVTEKRGRKVVYSIHPWFLPYFKEKLTGINEKKLVEEAYRSAKLSKRLLMMEPSPGICWPEWRESLNNFKGLLKELIESVKKVESHLRFGVYAIPVPLALR